MVLGVSPVCFALFSVFSAAPLMHNGPYLMIPESPDPASNRATMLLPASRRQAVRFPRHGHSHSARENRPHPPPPQRHLKWLLLIILDVLLAVSSTARIFLLGENLELIRPHRMRKGLKIADETSEVW